MRAQHFKLWSRCRDFVGCVCAGRDSTHGLAHMEQVTENAVLIHSLREVADSAAPAPTLQSVAAAQWQSNYDLYRIILVGMLHDVADHKYDHDGTLETTVNMFIEAEAEQLVELAATCDRDGAAHRQFFSPVDASAIADGSVARLIATSTKAISYSTEKKRGMRWFEKDGDCPDRLPTDWCYVRDCVSDADKLEAIGGEGLLRCYAFSIHRWRESGKAARFLDALDRPATPGAKLAQLEAAILQDVAEHYDEKLGLLLSEFIVTGAGKFLGAPMQEEMDALLDEWKAAGAPPVTLYWREAAAMA